MFRNVSTVSILGVLCLLLLGLTACAEAPPPVDEAEEEAPKPVEFTGPYYEVTKDTITDKADWTSRNITLFGAKIGDKTTAIEKNLGELDSGDTVGDHIRTIYEKGSYAVYTHKMTGQLQKIELFDRFADRIKDPKLKRLVSSANLEYMREILGPEEGLDINPLTTGAESLYDARGFRFVKYELAGGIKLNSLLFSQMKR